jgi:hypothetical protein
MIATLVVFKHGAERLFYWPQTQDSVGMNTAICHLRMIMESSINVYSQFSTMKCACMVVYCEPVTHLMDRWLKQVKYSATWASENNGNTEDIHFPLYIIVTKISVLRTRAGFVLWGGLDPPKPYVWVLLPWFWELIHMGSSKPKGFIEYFQQKHTSQIINGYFKIYLENGRYCCHCSTMNWTTGN